MKPLPRRSFTTQTLATLLSTCLFPQAARANPLKASLPWTPRPWLHQLTETSTALTASAIPPRAWQHQVEQSLRQLDLPAFLHSLDFDRLASEATYPTQGEGMQRLYFLDEAGQLQPLPFRPYLFTLRRGTAVVPHGHHNMATMHMVLQGRVRVRQFDRLEATATHMLIRPAADGVGGPGMVTTVSDDAHNVHWFEPLTDRVLMFNIGVYQVRPGPFGERDYLDPVGGERLAGGVIRAARLERAAAYAKYGH